MNRELDRTKKRFLTTHDLGEFQLPRRYWHLTHKDFVPRIYYQEMRDYILAMTDVLKEGRSLFIYGGSGKGKSALAYYIARVFAEYGSYVLFASAQDLHDSIDQRVWSPRDETLMEDFYRKEVGVLVVDDLGMEATRGKSRIPQLFNDRFHNLLPTIFTCTVDSVRELSKFTQYPDFMADKIWNSCASLHCGKSKGPP